jgi:hypothetical protein
MHVSQRAVADLYRDLIDAIIVDRGGDLPAMTHVAIDTLMMTQADRMRVAKAALDLARSVTERRSSARGP